MNIPTNDGSYPALSAVQTVLKKFVHADLGVDLTDDQFVAVERAYELITSVLTQEGY